MFYDDNYMNNNRDDDIDININNTSINNTQEMPFDNNMNLGMPQGPIVEPGKERYIQRNIIHEVRHICPINTRIINNHIYRHTYQPHYTCCEENVITNQQCGSCCQFK